MLELLVETQAFLVREIGDKDASIRRLRQLVFGARTEKTKNVVGKAQSAAPAPAASSPPETGTTKEEPKAKGHGRLGADAYLQRTPPRRGEPRPGARPARFGSRPAPADVRCARAQPAGRDPDDRGQPQAPARRQYVDVAESFPEEVRHVLEEIALVYRVDADAKRRGLSAEDRLRLHQAQSAPVMERLRAWLAALIEERKVEPNYLGLAGFDFSYGSFDTRSVAGGLCQDGMAISLDQFSGDDDPQLMRRHDLGHLLLSRWKPGSPSCSSPPGRMPCGTA